MPVWQTLYEELKDKKFMIISVAFDSREGDAKQWVEAAKPDYVTLVDQNHYVAELYNMVNVNQAVWIDEAGIIVRPTESAGAYEGFRKMNRETSEIPEDVAKITAFLIHDTDYTAYASVRSMRFLAPGPASSTVFVKGLVNPKFLIEIEAIAVAS